MSGRCKEDDQGAKFTQLQGLGAQPRWGKEAEERSPSHGGLWGARAGLQAAGQHPGDAPGAQEGPAPCGGPGTGDASGKGQFE